MAGLGLGWDEVDGGFQEHWGGDFKDTGRKTSRNIGIKICRDVGMETSRDTEMETSRATRMETFRDECPLGIKPSTVSRQEGPWDVSSKPHFAPWLLTFIRRLCTIDQRPATSSVCTCEALSVPPPETMESLLSQSHKQILSKVL